AMSLLDKYLETSFLFGQFTWEFISLETLLWMLGAVIIGILFGTLPGLSATIGIALFAGITYGWPLQLALVVLLGVYVGAIYGGSVSAILLNIPGTGSAAATCLDGHPLAMSGQASTANTLARTSSLIGTLFGLVIFLFFTPLMTRIALEFTSPEFFWLAVFGILICGSLANPEYPLKGWIAGLFGVLLALVGLDNLHGAERLTFGIDGLLSGLPFVPMTIAFFGIPQIVKSMQETQPEVVQAKSLRATPLLPVLKRNLRNILKWGGIGTAIGAIPGVGENIAAWVAYDDAKRNHPHPEKFGTGVYEGVMAPETANNAAIGGSIIPLVSLGIPGSPPTAMLLAALMMHGIRPGPMLEQDHPEIIPQLGAILLWATLFLFICGLLMTPAMVALLKIR
ncbi:MAG: tripartite tricarboxylate transporter permease, partial [Verrucomicrobiae bacterium]|nr:tripartite tricarboxylate transporter permease [Verrucomicrobiae bacterium]